MKNVFSRAAAVLAVIALALLAAPAGAQCVSLTSVGSAYTQDFNTLSSTAGSTTNTLAITGWFLTESGGGARDNEQYAVDTGASTTGDTFSYGAAADAERALGGLQSGTLIPTYGACFTNNTGSTLTSLDVAYTGEEWRLGTAARTDQISFEYSLNATDLVTGTWTNVAALNFVTPNTATTGAKVGNDPANRTALSSSIPGMSIANGATFWIRWIDANASGADDGLSVDDFSLTPQGAPPLPTLTIDDVAQLETNAGTTTFTFTVSLSTTSHGGVTFDIATADNTATTADSDYAANSSTGVAIANGFDTATFDVTVNGDAAVEPNETFFVNVTNIVGANGFDTQGQGTIQNDDSPPNLSISDVSMTEGHSGTKTFAFSVTLDAPAQGGGVTFDIGTTDNTATTAGSDYVASSLTGQTIAAGSSGPYTFNVTVNGDVAVEGDETFFVNVTNVTGATVLDNQGLGTIQNDDATPTLIHDVQGNGAASPMAGATVTIDGIVTASFQGASPALGGFFVQEENADVDADPATSEGIFVYQSATPVAVGDRVSVIGTVVEYFNMTELSPVSSVVVLSSGNTLPDAAEPPVPAPVSPADDWERFEAMRVTFTQPLYVTNTYDLARVGEISLSANGPLQQPTNSLDPQDDAAAVAALQALNNRNQILLHDSRTGTNRSPIAYLPPGGTIRIGDSVTSLEGVLNFQFGDYSIEPTSAPVFNALNPRPPAPPAVGAPAFKAAFANVLNYFVAPFPDPTGRGASDATEFSRQQTKVVAELAGLGADVIGLSELEKAEPALTGAAASIAAALSTATGESWAAIADPWASEASNPGTDPDIKCGIIYKTSTLTPLGVPMTDTVAAAGTYSRAPFAQAFTVNATGGQFVFVVSHFRSRSCSGASGLDLDQGDGQGCYNNRRTSQANATISFVNTALVPISTSVLVVGDLNAYAEEDPVDAFRAAGFTDLVAAGQTSYSFSGQQGRIDHALATAAMTPHVTGAGVWKINADEPVVFDWEMSNKPVGYPYEPNAYRAADHDPVVVGVLGTVPVELTTFTAE